MDVFIGNLPANGRLIDLEEILGGQSLHSRFELRTGKDCFDRDYHYFVVFDQSAGEAKALIEALNERDFKGNQLTAREFVRREECNSPAEDWNREERRVNSSQ